MDRSRTAIAALGAVFLLATAGVGAQQRVYQWTDANGVTHYTDLPPSQSHKSREIGSRSRTAADLAAAKPSESPQCVEARANLQRLQGGQALGVDTDGDGKADRSLDPAERSTQTELHQAAVKAYCAPAK